MRRVPSASVFASHAGEGRYPHAVIPQGQPGVSLLCTEVSLKPFGDLHPKNQHGKHHINQTTNLGVPKSHQPLRRLWHWQQPLSAALLCPKLFPFPSQQQGQGPACAKAAVCPWLCWEVPGLLLWAALRRSQPTQGCSTSERPPAPAAARPNAFLRASLPPAQLAAGHSQGGLPQQTALAFWPLLATVTPR